MAVGVANFKFIVAHNTFFKDKLISFSCLFGIGKIITRNRSRSVHPANIR